MSSRHVSASLSRLCTVHSREVTDEMALEYIKALGECDAVLLDEATSELISSSPFMPKPAEILAIVRRLEAESPSQPAEPEHWQRDAYRCQNCRDSGYVCVWHPTAMQSAIWHVRGKIPRERLRLPTCDARCTCSIGMAKPAGVSKRKYTGSDAAPEPVHFRSPPMIHVDPAMSATQQIDTLLAWARTWEPKERDYEWDPNAF